MKRELMSVLIGAALLVPADANAQRNRDRSNDRGERVQKLAPVTTGGRVAPRGVRAGVRPLYNGRVVYSAGRPGRGARYNGRIVYRPHRAGFVTVRADWGRVRLHFDRRQRFDRRLGQGELRRLLGRETVDRLRWSGRRVGLRGSLRGHWVDTRRNGLVLVVTMDRVDIAEFIDFDRDGFIDDAFIFDHGQRRGWNQGW
ncbi:MAG: hypothetical protein OEN56_08505 [Gemmatimonadota bacterium]|nr:hypothetical protein [Gemmatimonadota bacterium]